MGRFSLFHLGDLYLGLSHISPGRAFVLDGFHYYIVAFGHVCVIGVASAAILHFMCALGRFVILAFDLTFIITFGPFGFEKYCFVFGSGCVWEQTHVWDYVWECVWAAFACVLPVRLGVRLGHVWDSTFGAAFGLHVWVTFGSSSKVEGDRITILYIAPKQFIQGYHRITTAACSTSCISLLIFQTHVHKDFGGQTHFFKDWVNI